MGALLQILSEVEVHVGSTILSPRNKLAVAKDLFSNCLVHGTFLQISLDPAKKRKES